MVKAFDTLAKCNGAVRHQNYKRVANATDLCRILHPGVLILMVSVPVFACVCMWTI